MRVSPVLLLLALSLLFLTQSAAEADSGFVRVEQIDGVWWFINAEGEPFVSVGVNHVEPHLWLAPYNKESTLERYGSDFVDSNGHFETTGVAAKKWIDRQVEIIDDLHFNTFGVHTHHTIDPALYRDQVYHLARLNTAPLAGWRERNGEGPRPDVFSEDFRCFAEQRVKEVTSEHKESRKLLGYIYTDIPSWVMGKADQKALGNTVMIYPWVNAILPLGEASPGKQRWLELLAERYDSAAAAAEVWGLRVSPTYGITWADMARRVDWTSPTDEDKADADMQAFLHLIADQWYCLHRELLHEHDPNHLIFGDKQMINLKHPWVIESLKQHVDAICVQTYGRWADDGPVMAELYAATGKPIFNGDGCFSFAQPEQQEWGVKGFRTGARSVAEVAEFYKETLEMMMADPHIIGWHHCGYLQQWDKAERGDSPRNENGFLDPFEKPLTEWTNVIREVNVRAVEMHGEALSSGYPEKENDQEKEKESQSMAGTEIEICMKLAIPILTLVAVIALTAAESTKPSTDPYGGTTTISTEATGFFRTEEIDGRHWFITPEGNAFFPVALSHLFSGESDLAAKNVYGGDADAWLTDSFAKAQAMGFNCALGSATSPERNLNGFVEVEKAEALFREHSFPYTVGVILLKHPWEFVEGETLPDIFDPSYEALIEERAKAVCPKYKDDPLVMGYYYGFGAFNKADQWVNHHLSLPVNAPGRVAVVDVLIEQYGNDVAAFNAVYGTELTAISDLKTTGTLVYAPELEKRNYPSLRPMLDADQLADFEAIIQHMCITLYKIGHTAIRRYDENHLILGSFIKEWALDIDSWRAAAPYVDVMAPQHLNREIDVNAIARAIDKPIIFSDEYFGFHFPDAARGHAALTSHDARGEVYRTNLMRHYKDPQCIGVTYCACLFDQGGDTLAKGNQNGFYSLTGEPRTTLIEAVTEINREWVEHASEPADQDGVAEYEAKLWATWDQWSVKPYYDAATLFRNQQRMKGKAKGAK